MPLEIDHTNVLSFWKYILIAFIDRQYNIAKIFVMALLFNELIDEIHIGCNLPTKVQHFGLSLIDYHLDMEQNFSSPF